jgi:formylglycine-generating enzyme required for sulfatase activity
MEWTWDFYAAYEGDATDPTGVESGEYRTIRGGAWGSNPSSCRSGNREDWAGSIGRDRVFGIRVVRSL